jgi:hypothetical protein
VAGTSVPLKSRQPGGHLSILSEALGSSGSRLLGAEADGLPLFLLSFFLLSFARLIFRYLLVLQLFSSFSAQKSLVKPPKPLNPLSHNNIRMKLSYAPAVIIEIVRKKEQKARPTGQGFFL